jgi:pimeloyl-ACP methyl ester carboxylesterase
VLSVLFPANQTAAAKAYLAGILEYPGFYATSATVRDEQNAAIAQWMAGRDLAGQHLGDIRAQTLVADGKQDALNPVYNDWLLAGNVLGARLILYPDAGHAFLFQDAAAFIPAVDTFLAQHPS